MADEAPAPTSVDAFIKALAGYQTQQGAGADASSQRNVFTQALTGDSTVTKAKANPNYQPGGYLPGGSGIHVTPSKNINILNGITTYDLLLISRHILGVGPFDVPSKFIAADINKNNQVTTFDIVELRKMILGIYTDFPANKSWRFIPKNWRNTEGG